MCISDDTPSPDASHFWPAGALRRLLIGKSSREGGGSCQRTAIGETVEPVAPRIFSAVMMKANS